MLSRQYYRAENLLISFISTTIAVAAFVVFAVCCAHDVRAEENASPSYFELGVVASSLLQPSIGYWWGRTGVRYSGMYLHKSHHESHLNFGYQLSDSKNVQRSINLLTSWVVASDPGADYDYAATGVAYGMNYKGFFFEIGLAIPWRDELGNLDNDPVIPAGYWGYLHRFK